MPMTTYAEVRPWAREIRDAVVTRRMPPWFADPRYGHFSNDPSLSADEIDIIKAWAAAGAPAGSKRDAPPPVHWPADWRIGKPDLVVSMSRPFPIPANGTIEYQYIILPASFAQDRWVRAVEIRPGNRAVVHHAVLYVREPGSEWLRDVPKGVMYAPPAADAAAKRAAGFTTSDILAVYTPGALAMTCPPGMAKKIPAGSDLVLQIHYTSRPTAQQDQTRVALVYSEVPRQRILTLQMDRNSFTIPPGAADYTISVSGTLPRNALLISMLPHMHLRGSEFDYQMAVPGQPLQTLLRVKPYDFYWQLSYRLKQPIQLHGGDRLVFTAHYDNSANNPRNPDSTATVHAGEQSWEEMMVGFFDLAVEPDVNKNAFFAARRRH